MKNFSKYLLRHIEDDGEYFTVKSSGRSGMSQRGLARFIGKAQPSVGWWVNKTREADPDDNSLPEPLKPFAGKRLTLAGYSDPGGRDIVDDRFCSALVEYFAWWASDAKNNLKAKQAFSLIRDIGMRQLIHLKTGWHSGCSKEDFQELREKYEQRRTARDILKDELRPELMSAVQEWQKTHYSSRSIYSQTHDALNESIQGLKSKQIKKQNGLTKSSLIRDYYDTRHLIDYAAVSRFAANLIRFNHMHPVEAVKLACVFYFTPKHSPEPFTLVENINKVGKLIEASQQDENRLPDTP